MKLAPDIDWAPLPYRNREFAGYGIRLVGDWPTNYHGRTGLATCRPLRASKDTSLRSASTEVDAEYHELTNGDETRNRSEAVLEMAQASGSDYRIFSERVMHLQSIKDPVAWITAVYQHEGASLYGGERITQLEHALQCALITEQEGRPAALIVAALLHDLGHLVYKFGRDAAEKHIDDRHESIGGAALARWFPASVTEPIRLHVAAKRYLCAVDAGYHDGLSAGSQRSLRIQGGAFSVADAESFIRQPFAAEAVTLRRWDDGAKVPGLATPDFLHFAPLMTRCLNAR